jgi:hypothetical protein
MSAINPGIGERRLEAGLPLLPAGAPPARGAAAAEPALAPAAELATSGWLAQAEAGEDVNHDLQHQICMAVVERFGERMPAEAGETLYQVMMLVLLGPDSVHTGRRPAPTTNSFNL